MRFTITLAAIVSLAVFAACNGDRLPTSGEQPLHPKPLFDHVVVVPTVDVAVNNYVLQLRPDHVFNGFYKMETQTLFAGELSYGNAPDAVVFHNTRGTGGPHLEAAGLPIGMAAPGSFADHQTVSLLIERTGQELGPAVPVGLIVVRETFAFEDAPDDDYVILKYTLYNPRATPVENLHVGQILDHDLGDPDDPGFFQDDVVEYIAAGDLVRVSSASELPPVAGHAILRRPTTSYRASDGPFGDPLLNDPSTLAGWFDFLSGGIVNPGPVGGTGDIRHALSHGPVTIRGGEAEAFAFVLTGGDDADDLTANIAAARARYASLPLAARRPYPVRVVSVAIEPSPLDLRTETEFTAILQGVPKKLVPLFDRDQTFCGAPPATTSPATTLVRLKTGVRATFPITNLATRTRFRPGDEVVCGGRLTDGTLVVGRTTPSVGSLPLASATRLTSVGFNRAPTWSPDGSSIAFSSNRSGAFAIWRMNVEGGEGSAVQVTSGPDDHAPDWSGSTIAFGRGPTIGVGQVYSVSDAGGAVTLINAAAVNPRYSPDGLTIAFTRVTDNFHVWSMAAGGGGEAQVTAGIFEFHPEWSPDGSEIYFTDFSGSRGAIFKVSAVGGTPDRVTPEEGTDNRHPALSPDGRLLAFVSGAELVLQDLATDDHTVVPLDPRVSDIALTGAERNQNLEFSPDGMKLLFTAGGHIWVADLSGAIP
jgi:hypothetical protein